VSQNINFIYNGKLDRCIHYGDANCLWFLGTKLHQLLSMGNKAKHDGPVRRSDSEGNKLEPITF